MKEIALTVATMETCVDIPKQDMKNIKCVVESAADCKNVIEIHTSTFQDPGTHEYDSKLAFGKVIELDRFKACKMALNAAIETVTSLDEIADLARSCTAVRNLWYYPLNAYAAGLIYSTCMCYDHCAHVI